MGKLYKSIKNQLTSIVKSDFIQKIVETFTVRVLVIAIGLVTTIITSRILGPEGRGILALANSIIIIGIYFSNLGLTTSNIYYAAKNEVDLPKIVGNSLLVSSIAGGFLCALFYFLFINFSSLSPLKDNLIMLIVLASIPIALAYLLLSNIFIGIHQTRTFNILEISNRVIAFIGIGIIFFMFDISVANILLVILASNLVVLFLVKKKISHYTKKIEYSFSLFKKHMRYGFKSYVAGFFGLMVYRSDILMVNYFLEASATGYYSTASTMAEMVCVFPSITGLLLTPKLVKLASVQERWKLTKKTIWMTVGVMIPFCLLASVLPEFIIKLLLGEEFLPSVEPFVWLLPAVFVFSINTMIQSYFMAIGNPLIVIYSPLIGFLVNAVFNYFFIPKFGILGAAYSSIIAYSIMFALYLLYRFTVLKQL